MLILPIKRKWLDLIKAGIKKEEYRDDKPYYESRLGKYVNIGVPMNMILRNGYSAKSPQIGIKCLIKKGKFGVPEWGADPQKTYFIIEILKIYSDDVLQNFLTEQNCGR